jgi:hypothetical protein
VICRVKASKKRHPVWGLECWFLKEKFKRSRVIKALLSMFNLINIINSPTRFSRDVKSQIDVIIIENVNYVVQIRNIDVGYSDHLAQIPYLNV